MLGLHTFPSKEMGFLEGFTAPTTPTSASASTSASTSTTTGGFFGSSGGCRMIMFNGFE